MVLRKEDFVSLRLTPEEWADAEKLAEGIDRLRRSVDFRRVTQVPSPVLIFVRRLLRSGSNYAACAETLNALHVPTPQHGKAWYGASIGALVKSESFAVAVRPGVIPARVAADRIRELLADVRCVVDADDRAALDAAEAILRAY